ncbi:histidine-containing phosphotransfer protein [Musa troglodytarum]|uniref:Histidine-containing phosphotransfer protein n=1 Tax=Musa troglodytarum TaxID=320322 RepID=A0A9E7H1Z8_9LILI|nr:histidine-containing phosphotransfer protein [Musa troglodytarum]
MLPLCSRVLLSHPFSPMSLMALREQLNMLVNSMYIEGLLDQQFQQLQMLQDASSPGFVAEVINLFCEDAERILTELTKLVDQAVVDFQKVDAYVHQLKGSSSSVGAQNVKLACIQFRQFCEENNKDGCLNALNVVKHHYYLLRNKFDTMLQESNRTRLERSIVDRETNLVGSGRVGSTKSNVVVRFGSTRRFVTDAGRTVALRLRHVLGNVLGFLGFKRPLCPPSLPPFCCVLAADRIARCLAATTPPAEEVTSTPEARLRAPLLPEVHADARSQFRNHLCLQGP